MQRFSEQKVIRWGIIGCGAVCEKKSGPAFRKIPGSDLAAVMRRDGFKARDYAERHQVPVWYDEADELIQDPEVDAVYIATPPSSHCEHTVRVAQTGKPVYVEKPMASTHDECRKMINACQSAGVPLFVAYYRRCLPNFLKVKELADSGICGDIRAVRIELIQPVRPADLNREEPPWRVQPDIAGGGYFYDLASHQLDFLDYLFGPVSSVSGTADNQADLYDAEDIVCANFKFENGVMGTGLWCFTTSETSRRDEITIIGSGGEIVFSAFDHDVPIILRTQRNQEQFIIPMPEHIQQPLIQTIVDELHGIGQCPSTGESAARTNLVMENIVQDYYR